MTPIEARVRRLLSRSAMVAEEQVQPDVELSALGMGSLEQIECVLALEEELQVELPVADLRSLRTVGDVIRAVEVASGNART